MDSWVHAKNDCNGGGIGVYPVRPQVPAVGGYEGVGEVYAIGSAVKNLAPGDWVIPSPPSFGTVFHLYGLFSSHATTISSFRIH